MSRIAYVLPLASLVTAGLFSGCGSVNTGPDASTTDADISGAATVETEAALFGGSIGTNVGNIDIISMLPNNTVLETVKTDAAGNASIKVYPGGSVTAVYKHTVDMGADLITYVGVKPGDTLVFGSRNFSLTGQTGTNLGSQTYSWPVQTGVANHCIFTSCGGSCNGVNASTTLAESSTCHREPMDILYVGLNASGLISHYNLRSNVAFTNGQNVAIGGWAVAPNATLTVSGVPPEVSTVSGNWASVVDAATEYAFAQSYNGAPTGGAFSSTFAFHATGDRTLGRVAFSRQNFQAIQIVDQFNANTLTQTVAAPALTPWLQGAVAVSAALRTASWFLISDANSVADGLVLRLTWNHVVSAMNNSHQWHIIMPPGQTSIALPKLPAAFNDNLPASQDFINGQVRVFDISTVNGYDAVRTTVPSRNIMCVDCALRAGDFQRVVSSGTVQ